MSAPRKSAAKAKAPAAAKTTSANAKAPGRATTLLAGGNPRIAKDDGDAPVQAYIAAMPGWKREVGEWLDGLIERNVPHVRKVVRWNSPMYGVEGHGFFLSLHVFARYVKVAFFFGTSLTPVPPGTSKSAHTRYFHIGEGDALDEERMASWVRQAAAIPGWDGGSPRLYGGSPL